VCVDKGSTNGSGWRALSRTLISISLNFSLTFRQMEVSFWLRALYPLPLLPLVHTHIWQMA